MKKQFYGGKNIFVFCSISFLDKCVFSEMLAALLIDAHVKPRESLYEVSDF